MTGVSLEAARASGLRKGLPVIAGGGDNAAAAVGCGAIRPDVGFVSLGTSGVTFVPTADLRIDPSGALHAFCHAVPGQYHLMGVTLPAGGALRWFRDAIAPEQAAEALAAGRDPCEVLVSQAAEVAAGAEGLFFLPYLAGERTPHMDPDARGAWLGLPLAHGRRHLLRALLEGVSFALGDSLELMRALDVSPARLHVLGGGARNPHWREILAAVLKVPLQRLAAEEGPAFGAALLAQVGAGIHPSVEAAVAAGVQPSGRPEWPDPDLAGRYAELHGRFRQLYPALKAADVFRSAEHG